MQAKPWLSRAALTLPFVTVGMIAGTALGQDEASMDTDDQAAERTAEDAGSPWRFALSAGGNYQFDTDIDDGGEFNVGRFNVGAGVGYAFSEEFRIDGRFSYEYSSYDFSGSRGLGGLDPWSDIDTYRINVAASYALSENWMIFGGPVFSWSGEDGASSSDSFTAGGTIGARTPLNDQLSLAFGLFITEQIEDDTAIFPIITFDWTINDQWTLRSGQFDLGSEGGAGLELGWAMNESFELAFGAQYQTRRFRLDKNNDVAPDGVGEDTKVPLYARLVWRPDQNIDLSLTGGVVVGGELTLENERGREISEEDYDPAGFIGLRGSIRF